MMRLSPLALTLVLCCMAPCSSAFAQEAAAKAKVEALLKKSAEEFLAVIQDVNEQQWSFKGNGIRHSIGEEAEHVCFAEQELQRLIHNALRATADPKRAAELKGKEEEVRVLMLEAPKGAENYRARGRINSKIEVLEYFPVAHNKLLQLLTASKELSTHIFKHPSKDYGELTALQWFYYIAYHKQRHIKQIKAIKAHQDYPGRVRTAQGERLNARNSPGAPESPARSALLRH